LNSRGTTLVTCKQHVTLIKALTRLNGRFSFCTPE
jgi:hypothetical protein